MKKNSSVSVFYGRARRIEIVEKIAYITVGFIAILLVFSLVFKQERNVDYNVNFAYLRNYLEGRGFQCEMIHLSGGQCYISGDYSTRTFVRYEDGFEYFVKTESYLLDIRHTLKEENLIRFKTTSEAFVGYKNKEYTCEYVSNVIKELKQCKTEDGEVLDLDSYIGLIEHSIIDINNIIDSSGYYKSELLENYKWVKK